MCTEGNDIGYGDDETASGFVNLIIVYITFKLIPFLLLFFERAIFWEYTARSNAAVAAAKRAEDRGEAAPSLGKHESLLRGASVRGFRGLTTQLSSLHLTGLGRGSVESTPRAMSTPRAKSGDLSPSV
jgi:hypothetical protein